MKVTTNRNAWTDQCERSQSATNHTGRIVDRDWKILSRRDGLQKWSARKAVEQLLTLREVNSNALSIQYHCEELRRFAVSGRVCDCLPSKSDPLTERRLRDVLALRR